MKKQLFLSVLLAFAFFVTPTYAVPNAPKPVEKEAIKAVMNSLDKASYTNPVSFGINVARKTITIAAKAISKSVGI